MTGDAAGAQGRRRTVRHTLRAKNQKPKAHSIGHVNRRSLKQVQAQQPKAYTPYDIREALVEFDSQRLLHRNEPWSGGDRYAVVFFNKDFNYVGERECARSCRLAEQPMRELHWLPRGDGGGDAAAAAAVREAKDTLDAVCARTNFPRDSSYAYTAHSYAGAHSKYGGNDAWFVSLGWTVSREGKRDRLLRGERTKRRDNVNNQRFKALYQALLRYMHLVYPGVFGPTAAHRYTSCIVAKNSQCAWHRDNRNVGPAAIMAFGTYTRGGRLLVEDEAARTAAVDPSGVG